MNNNDERDYEEEEANRRLMEEGDYDPHIEMPLCDCKVTGIAKVAQEVQHWYVTFGYDHKDPVTNVRLAHRYCIVEDTYEGARDQISARFGTGWSMIYPNANDLPIAQRIVNGQELPPYKWRGAGVQEHGLTYFNHKMEEPIISIEVEDRMTAQLDGLEERAAELVEDMRKKGLTFDDKLELDREKAGYYDPEG